MRKTRTATSRKWRYYAPTSHARGRDSHQWRHIVPLTSLLHTRIVGLKLLWHAAVTKLLASGSAAFIWKLRCHWLRDLRQRKIVVIIQAPSWVEGNCYRIIPNCNNCFSGEFNSTLGSNNPYFYTLIETTPVALCMILFYLILGQLLIHALI